MSCRFRETKLHKNLFRIVGGDSKYAYAYTQPSNLYTNRKSESKKGPAKVKYPYVQLVVCMLDSSRILGSSGKASSAGGQNCPRHCHSSATFSVKIWPDCRTGTEFSTMIATVGVGQSVWALELFCCPCIRDEFSAFERCRVREISCHTFSDFCFSCRMRCNFCVNAK